MEHMEKDDEPPFFHLALCLMLAALVALITWQGALILSLFGAELISARKHHARRHKKSPLDHDYVRTCGWVCLALGFVALLWFPSGDLKPLVPGVTLVLIMCSQFSSYFLHWWRHSSARAWGDLFPAVAFAVMTLMAACTATHMRIFLGVPFLR